MLVQARIGNGPITLPLGALVREAKVVADFMCDKNRIGTRRQVTKSVTNRCSVATTNGCVDKIRP